MVHFVYPYIIPNDPRFGWELMFSIRSIYEHFKGEFKITIVGECPTWLDTTISNFQFIEFKNPGDDYPRVQSKVALKLKAVLETTLDEGFVLMHDDMYFIQDVTIDDLKVPRYISPIIHLDREDASQFGKQLLYTKELLKKSGIKYVKNYSNHCPIYFDRKKLLHLMHEFNACASGAENGLVLDQAYLSYYEKELPTPEFVGSFRVGYWAGIQEGNPETAKILNHDEQGFLENPGIITSLSVKFKNKSPLEINT